MKKSPKVVGVFKLLTTFYNHTSHAANKIQAFKQHFSYFLNSICLFLLDLQYNNRSVFGSSKTRKKFDCVLLTKKNKIFSFSKILPHLAFTLHKN